MSIVIKDQFLEAGEYFKAEYPKNVIYIHHTAGGHRPDWVIHGWDTDDHSSGKARIVATAFVIGGLSISNGESEYDGKIYRAFDEKYWAHHLGTKFSNNTTLNKKSIGIELCNYGPLTLGKNGVFYNYVNKPVPKEMVVTLDAPFRGFKHYHAYTDKQIQATKDLIIDLNSRYPETNFGTPLLSAMGFEVNADAKSGKAGIYSHSNVRSDKFDMSPQPKLIAMLKSL